MATREELQFNITAKDHASPVFTKVGKNASSSMKDVEKTATKTGTAAGTQMATGFRGSLSKGLGSIPIDKFIGAAAIGGAIKFAVNAASSLQESMSKSDAVFRQNSQAVKDWAATAADSFGQSQAQALEAAGTFGNLFQAFGVGLKPATEMSMTLTQLASDLASFNDTTVQEAIEAIRSGLSGETEPLKRYGVALTDARLKQEALGMGLIKDVKAPLDAATKSQAAYSLIMKDTALAQGDFARTADGYANSMRTLQSNVSDVAAAMGKELLPSLAALAKIAAEGIDIVLRFTTEGARLTGNKQVDDFIQDVTRTVTDSLNPIKVIGKFQEGVGQPFAELFGGGEMSNAAKDAAVLSEEMQRVSRAYASAHGGAVGYSVAMQQVNNANNQVGDSVSMAREGVRTYGQAIREANSALQEHINIQLAMVDSGFAVANSYRQFQAAAQAAAEAIDDASTAVNEQQAAYDDATQAAIANASATVAYAQKQAEAEGSTLSARQSQELLIGTLQKLAGQASGPVASAIGAVIAKLQAVGQQKPNPTISANDQATGKINSVSASLNALNGRSATVALNAIFNGGAAMSEANRFLSIARAANDAASRLPVRKEGGPIPGGKGQAVPILAHGGEYVLSADVVDRIKKGQVSEGAATSLSLPGSGGGGTGTVVNFNITTLDPISAAREVKRVLAAGTRVGVS